MGCCRHQKIQQRWGIKNLYMNETKTKEDLLNQHFWNIAFLAISALVFTVGMRFFGPEAAGALAGVTPFQFIVLSLAAFRMTRLLVADYIMLWLRDMCVNVKEETSPETGLLCVVREKPLKGARLLFANLLGCPWCVGVWMAFLVIVMYIGVVLDVFPMGRVIIYIFAIAGAASLIQTIVSGLMAQRATDGVHLESQNKAPWNGQDRRESPNVCTDCGLK